MADKTITLRADLVDRLETLASEQGRTVDALLEEMLPGKPPAPEKPKNWALAVVRAAEEANIEWEDLPGIDAASESGNLYYEDRYQRWLELQQREDSNE